MSIHKRSNATFHSVDVEKRNEIVCLKKNASGIRKHTVVSSLCRPMFSLFFNICCFFFVEHFVNCICRINQLLCVSIRLVVVYLLLTNVFVSPFMSQCWLIVTSLSHIVTYFVVHFQCEQYIVVARLVLGYDGDGERRHQKSNQMASMTGQHTIESLSNSCY